MRTVSSPTFSWKLPLSLQMFFSLSLHTPLPSQGIPGTEEAQSVTWVTTGLHRAMLGERDPGLWRGLVSQAAELQVITLPVSNPRLFPYLRFPLPYQSGSSGGVSGRRWETFPAGCMWGSRCILGWRPVSAGGPGSHRCPGEGGRTVSMACCPRTK